MCLEMFNCILITATHFFYRNVILPFTCLFHNEAGAADLDLPADDLDLGSYLRRQTLGHVLPLDLQTLPAGDEPQEPDVCDGLQRLWGDVRLGVWSLLPM